MPDENVLIISSDCHAGALPSIYDEFMSKKYHGAHFCKELGVDEFMWGPDYPRSEGTWPNT